MIASTRSAVRWSLLSCITQSGVHDVIPLQTAGREFAELIHRSLSQWLRLCSFPYGRKHCSSDIVGLQQVELFATFEVSLQCVHTFIVYSLWASYKDQIRVVTLDVPLASQNTQLFTVEPVCSLVVLNLRALKEAPIAKRLMWKPFTMHS